MNMRAVVFGFVILFASCSAAAFACENRAAITKIVFVDSFGAGVERTSLADSVVCFNFRKADRKLDRNRIGEKDGNNRWPAAISLESGEEVLRITWPDRTDILARFKGSEGTYREGGYESCAIVGEVGLFRATRLYLDFENVNPGTYKGTFVGAKGFEFSPSATSGDGCIDLQRRVSPTEQTKLGFKIAREIADGQLEIEVPGQNQRIQVTFSQLIEAADESKAKSALRQENDARGTATTVSLARLAVDAFKPGEKQIKVPDGFISVTYETIP